MNSGKNGNWREIFWPYALFPEASMTSKIIASKMNFAKKIADSSQFILFTWFYFFADVIVTPSRQSLQVKVQTTRSQMICGEHFWLKLVQI